MAYERPSVDDFKDYFDRDFPFAPEDDPDNMDYVRDKDIEKAQGEAYINVNDALASDQEQYSLFFNYMTAHYLVTDIGNSSQGLAGRYSWIESSKSVGSVSESFSIPQRILDNPELAMISKTTYGAKYLSMIVPLLTGVAFCIAGRTHA